MLALEGGAKNATRATEKPSGGYRLQFDPRRVSSQRLEPSQHLLRQPKRTAVPGLLQYS